MAQSTLLQLLPATTYINPGNGAPYTVTGEYQPAAAYYLGNRDLQTVNFKLNSCTGNILIEATLASSPVAIDWFRVYEFEANANASPNSAPQIASNASAYTNIEGNFVYLRAKIEDFQGGIVEYVKLSY
jgi:hypothetical protein